MSLHHTTRIIRDNPILVDFDPIEAIFFYCLECTGEDLAAIEECFWFYCPCHPYRFGSKPERAGIGAVGNTRN
jgi:hypothetical protein